jgi:hypothetical protein
MTEQSDNENTTHIPPHAQHPENLTEQAKRRDEDADYEFWFSTPGIGQLGGQLEQQIRAAVAIAPPGQTEAFITEIADQVHKEQLSPIQEDVIPNFLDDLKIKEPRQRGLVRQELRDIRKEMEEGHEKFPRKLGELISGANEIIQHIASHRDIPVGDVGTEQIKDYFRETCVLPTGVELTPMILTLKEDEDCLHAGQLRMADFAGELEHGGPSPVLSIGLDVPKEREGSYGHETEEDKGPYYPLVTWRGALTCTCEEKLTRVSDNSLIPLCRHELVALREPGFIDTEKNSVSEPAPHYTEIAESVSEGVEAASRRFVHGTEITTAKRRLSSLVEN